jgi:hypothetical protein
MTRQLMTENQHFNIFFDVFGHRGETDSPARTLIFEKLTVLTGEIS